MTHQLQLVGIGQRQLSIIVMAPAIYFKIMMTVHSLWIFTPSNGTMPADITRYFYSPSPLIIEAAALPKICFSIIAHKLASTKMRQQILQFLWCIDIRGEYKICIWILNNFVSSVLHFHASSCLEDYVQFRLLIWHNHSFYYIRKVGWTSPGIELLEPCFTQVC